MFQFLRKRFHLKDIDKQRGESSVLFHFNTLDRGLLNSFDTHKLSSYHHHTRFPRSMFAADKQSTCVMNCTDKFLKHSERVGARFAEHNAGKSSEMWASEECREPQSIDGWRA
jgi:hypothetical protein